MSEQIESQNGKKAPTRSPSYPYTHLEDALKKAEAFRLKEGRNAARPEVAVTHWGYSQKSSGGKQTLAALRAFGLVEAEGSVRLTELALRILLDKRDSSPERVALIKQAALNPPMHKRLWERYGPDLPSPVNLRHSLIFEEGFNENTVDDFIREYRATIAFARLNESGKMPSEGEELDENPSLRGAMQQPLLSPSPQSVPGMPSAPVVKPAVFYGGGGWGEGTLPPVTFPLSGDNALEIRLRSKISPTEFKALKPVLMALLELSIVDRSAPMIPAPLIPSSDPSTFVEAEEGEG